MQAAKPARVFLPLVFQKAAPASENRIDDPTPSVSGHKAQGLVRGGPAWRRSFLALPCVHPHVHLFNDFAKNQECHLILLSVLGVQPFSNDALPLSVSLQGSMPRRACFCTLIEVDIAVWAKA